VHACTYGKEQHLKRERTTHIVVVPFQDGRGEEECVGEEGEGGYGWRELQLSAPLLGSVVVLK